MTRRMRWLRRKRKKKKEQIHGNSSHDEPKARISLSPVPLEQIIDATPFQRSGLPDFPPKERNTPEKTIY